MSTAAAPSSDPRPQRPPIIPGRAGMPRIALLGNPNTGKTTLFNRLTGLRHKTSNFPGTTLEARLGRIRLRGPAPARAACGEGCGCSSGEPPLQEGDAELIDLPGIYSLELDQLEAQTCRDVLAGRIAPRGDTTAEPEAVCVIADATNLCRNLLLVGEALRRRLPTVVAVNMIDIARRRGIRIDPAKLSEALGCKVVCTSARTGEGLAELSLALAAPTISTTTPPGDDEGLRAWADEIYAQVASGEPDESHDTFTDRLDRAFTHPVLGVGIFAAVMAALFWMLFSIASYPMDLIDSVFATTVDWTKGLLPEGILTSLLTDGVIAGVGATVIFLPQICLLFFVISLLEDTGYLARAAFVMDRALRPFGLPGHAFVPLLSSHACAIPGIMATRAIPDRRERLATILIAPFMTCSARLPVYVLVTTLLFRDRPALAALAFVGAYALGILAGVLSALLARRTILRGASRPMALELPSYKIPSLSTALLTTWDRGVTFIKSAGTNILAICVVLWWLSTYPQVPPPAEAQALREQAAALAAAAPEDAQTALAADGRSADELLAAADRLETSHAAAGSFAGRIGKFIQPVFAPLGYDWQLSVGVLSSFAAREVFVSTMAVVTTGEDDVEDEGVLSAVAGARRDDGLTPIFTTAVCWSLLVYYVLAMQCLPTLAVTAREAGGLKWALLQLGWMCGVAYAAALVVFQSLRAAGIA